MAKDVVQDACITAVRERVRQERPKVEKVERVDAGETRQVSDGETGVRGQGQFLGGGGNWRQFTYDCVYSTRSGKVTSVTYEERGGDDEIKHENEGPLDRSRPWGQKCEQAVQQRLRHDHPRSERLQFLEDTERQHRISGSETGVRGQAKFQGRTGKWHWISFECIYDARTGDVTSANFQPR